MHVSGCRLTEKQQDRLAEFFIAGVTARTAADLLGVNRKTAAYFYHRLREIIAREMLCSSPFAGQVEIDRAISAAIARASAAAARLVRSPSLASSSAPARSIL